LYVFTKTVLCLGHSECGRLESSPFRFAHAAGRGKELTHIEIRIRFGSMPTISRRQPNGGAPGKTLRTDGRANSEVRQMDRMSEPSRICILWRRIASPVSMHIESVIPPKGGTHEKPAT